MEEDEDAEGPYNALVEDACDIIMHFVDEIDPLYALMLSCTCKRERRRYARLLVHHPDAPVGRRFFTYRSVYLEQCSGEEGYEGVNGYVLRGEKGFEAARKDDYRAFYRRKRRSYDKINARHKKDRERKEGKRRKQAWSRGVYDE